MLDCASSQVNAARGRKVVPLLERRAVGSEPPELPRFRLGQGRGLVRRKTEAIPTHVVARTVSGVPSNPTWCSWHYFAPAVSFVPLRSSRHLRVLSSSQFGRDGLHAVVAGLISGIRSDQDETACCVSLAFAVSTVTDSPCANCAESYLQRSCVAHCLGEQSAWVYSPQVKEALSRHFDDDARVSVLKSRVRSPWVRSRHQVLQHGLTRL